MIDDVVVVVVQQEGDGWFVSIEVSSVLTRFVKNQSCRFMYYRSFKDVVLCVLGLSVRGCVTIQNFGRFDCLSSSHFRSCETTDKPKEKKSETPGESQMLKNQNLN